MLNSSNCFVLLSILSYKCRLHHVSGLHHQLFENVLSRIMVLLYFCMSRKCSLLRSQANMTASVVVCGSAVANDIHKRFWTLAYILTKTMGAFATKPFGAQHGRDQTSITVDVEEAK